MLWRAQVCPQLVGRQEELGALVARRHAAARGRGSLVLIEGEAGIGKSRLVATFRETLSNGRASVGLGICREFGGMPYAPIYEALGREYPGRPAFSATRAQALIELRGLLAAACEHRNRVLVLEDLQWADEGTLAFLHYVLTYIGTMRCLIVAPYRGDDIAEYVGAYLTRIVRDRATSRIALGPLTPALTRSMVRLSLGERAVSSAKVEEIVARSDGNPFFAEELLTNAWTLDGSRSTDAVVPTTIYAAVMERVSKLDATAIEIATRAAVIGQRFEPEFLSSTFGYSGSAVHDALERLQALRLVAEIGRRPPTYAFRHALTREAIYDSLPATDLRALHARVLEALEAAACVSPRDLGYHAWAAMNRIKCRKYNELAGDEAGAAHAHSEAVRLYELALRGDCNAEDRARLLLKAAVSASRDGMAERATQLYGAAARTLEGKSSPQRMAEIYYAMGSQARITGDNRRALDIIDRAVRRLPPGELRAKAMLHVTSAFMHLDRGEIELARELIAQAGAASDLPIYRNAVVYLALNTGDLATLRAASEAQIRACANLGSDDLLRARFNLAFDLCILGIDPEAMSEFDQLIPDLDEARLSSLQVLSYANAALLHARAGRFRAARDLVERGLAIPEPTTVGPIALCAAGITVALALGDGELAERCASERVVETAFASRINSTLGRLAGPYARWLHGRGEAGEARAVLRRASHAIAVPLGATETFLAAAELGDEETRDAAWARVPALEELAHLDLYAATAYHLRALKAMSSSNLSKTRRHAVEAARAYHALGWVAHEDRCLELAAKGDRSSARIDPLSVREREVAVLAASGSANKTIAATLGVGQRMVEKHLTSIYEKLDVRNRAQLAAFIAREAGGH